MVQPAAVDPLTAPRTLVAISSHGTGHMQWLRQVIQTYQRMPFPVDVVVFSEAPKDLGPTVEVIVGLPSANPWTLPFAHKRVFAECVADYDLFIYTEDDIGVTEANVRAFLRATPQLAPNEIAGFMRYEVAPDGTTFLTEPWGHFHWNPASVRRRGSYTVAEFTNEHAGFYILTQSQLRQAIASGGFLQAPYVSRYSWPETAATDPYTSCGFRKVICISTLDDFLVHHLPNRYVAQLPVSLAAFQRQIDILQRVRDGLHPATTLCEVEPRGHHNEWKKSFYDRPSTSLLELIPTEAQSVLSVGCGSGELERIIARRGARVTALPLDSVVGAEVAGPGIEIIYGVLSECLDRLAGRQFDCCVLTDLLHLQPQPVQIVERCLALLGASGTLVLGGPNFARMPWRLRRLRTGWAGSRPGFSTTGLTFCGPETFRRTFVQRGFVVTATKWSGHELHRAGRLGRWIRFGRLTARTWLLQARRTG